MLYFVLCTIIPLYNIVRGGVLLAISKGDADEKQS